MMFPRVRRRVERQPCVSCYMAQRHIHRIIVFDRKHLIVRQLQAAVLFYELFGNGQQFHPELRPRLGAFVDDPHIAPLVRVYIFAGEFLYVGIA